MNRLPHVVATASQMRLNPNEPMVVHYWWSRGGLGSFFPFPYEPDGYVPKWNLTESRWFVPGTVTE